MKYMVSWRKWNSKGERRKKNKTTIVEAETPKKADKKAREKCGIRDKEGTDVQPL